MTPITPMKPMSPTTGAVPRPLPPLQSSRDIARSAIADAMRGQAFTPRRSRWPGVLAVAAIAGGMAALFASSFAERHAERAAVAAPPAAVSDLSITERVKAALNADPAIATLQIDVSTHDGSVTLSGAVPDSATREQVTMLASASLGVRHVDNRLVLATAAARG